MAANIDSDLLDYVKSIPSYEELFGGLDYIAVDHCASIFGPAAYFLDIMRITDRYISDPNSQNIRSEEHTSELQSLMRISYAVFCLKKKKKTYQQTSRTYYDI